MEYIKPTENDWLTYSFTGRFYKNGNTPCRKELHIKKCGLSEEPKPDLLVIMMNPGGSHPIGSSDYKNIPDDLLDKFVPTVPDDTQWRVIEFMSRQENFIKSKGFKYAIVINLTDICEKDSKAFVKNKRKEKYYYNPKLIAKHSIFKKVLTCYKTSKYKNLPILIAWGVRPAFESMIENAINFLASCDNDIYGFRKRVNEKNTNYFYHPLARNKWLEKIELINK